MLYKLSTVSKTIYLKENNSIQELRKTKSIILFDGLCNFCDHSVQFVIKRDPDDEFLYASLQSKSGKEFLKNQDSEIQNIDSILLVTNEKIYTKSSAALKIASKLSAHWYLSGIFFILPKPLRDSVYDFIAKRRYQWFGKYDSCKIPTSEQRSKFLV